MEKSIQLGSKRKGNLSEQEKKEKGIDRVELRSWMENAPRNIPGIVWPTFSRDDVSFP